MVQRLSSDPRYRDTTVVETVAVGLTLKDAEAVARDWFDAERPNDRYFPPDATPTVEYFNVYQLIPESHGMFKVKGNIRTEEDAMAVAAARREMRPDLENLVCRLVDGVIVGHVIV